MDKWMGIERGESRRDSLRYSTERERYCKIKDQRERFRKETYQRKLRDRRKENGETEKETQEVREMRDTVEG